MVKKRVLALLFLALIIGVHTAAQGAPTGPFNQGFLDPVCFWVVEDSTEPDNQVSLTASSYGVGDFTLQYKYSSSGWQAFGTQQNISTGDDDYELVYLRLYDGSTEDTGGNLTFQGYEAPDDSYSPGLYNTVIIDWAETSFQLTIATAGADDNIAPVPIPHAALLLGSGVLGLIILGSRRRSVRE